MTELEEEVISLLHEAYKLTEDLSWCYTPNCEYNNCSICKALSYIESAEIALEEYLQDGR